MTTPHHAFIDESARKGRYLLTAVAVPSHDLDAIARQVRALFPKGNRRTHLSAESKARREGRAPAQLRYTHRGSRDEPLLSLPDAVGAGGTWRHLVDPIVTEVLVLGP